MSPDRTTITRAEAIRRRKEEEQKHREKLTQKNVAKPKPAPKPAVKSKVGWPAVARSVTPTTSRFQHRYDVATSAPHKQARSINTPKAPTISFTYPRLSFGPRWFSFFIALFCVADMYLMLNNDPFIIRKAEVIGNNRVDSGEIQNFVQILDLPAVYLDPIRIEIQILTAYSDIASAKVDVYLPGSVVITVEERTPVAAWHQDGQTVWVDAKGYAFPPRGQVQDLPEIMAAGAPPVSTSLDDESQPSGARPFLSPELSQAIGTLLPSLPQGSALVFDPDYGLGWNDPQGWKVYFGHSHGDNALKLKVYQTMLEYLSKNEIKPILISVEYPNAPYYRVEQ